VFSDWQRARDPRFDSLSGSFNKDLFEKSYSFLGEYRKAEVEQLHKELKKEKDEDRRREIQSVISRMVRAGSGQG
jgi:ribosomal RNA-processing protein 36